MHTDALYIRYIQAVLEVIEPRHIISFFIFLLFDWDDLYRKVERNFDLQSLDPTNLLVMVGWNTQQGQQPRVSLSLPATAKDIRRERETSSMTTEEEEKIKFLPAYPSPLLLSIDTQLLQIPFYFIFYFQIGAN